MQHLGESFQVPSPSAAVPSADVTLEAEKRLSKSFRAYVRRLQQERPGWSPAITPQARAAMWGRFALECDELLKKSKVPPIFDRVTIEAVSPDFPEGYRALAKELCTMLDQPKLLSVGGPRGTGKTMLASGLIRLFCQNGRSALYRTTKMLMDELGNAPWEEKERMRQLHRQQDLLVLDEVQVRDDRDWQDNELVELIDARYRENRATLLISNLESTKLAENLGDSIWRRLIESGGQPIITKWPRLQEWFASRRGRVGPPADSPALQPQRQ